MPIRLGHPPLEFNFYREQAGPANHPRVEIRPEVGVIIGGGAHVYKEDGSSPENMLTALYPEIEDTTGQPTTWVASSKNHATRAKPP